MSMVIDGQDFKVMLTPEAIGGADGKRSFIGSTEDAKNLIVVDGTLEPSRQDEVLLHELLHICDSGIPEFMVKNVSQRLYGYLKTNDLISAGLVDRVADGTLSAAEMAKVNKESNDLADLRESMGELIPSNYSVSEKPWSGAPGTYMESAGVVNRVGAHYAARDLVSGRLPPKAVRLSTEAKRLVRVYKEVLREVPPSSLVRLAQ